MKESISDALMLNLQNKNAAKNQAFFMRLISFDFRPNSVNLIPYYCGILLLYICAVVVRFFSFMKEFAYKNALIN